MLHGRKSNRPISFVQGHGALGPLGKGSDKWKNQKENMKLTSLLFKKTATPLTKPKLSEPKYIPVRF